jgi:hypothetical protein
VPDVHKVISGIAQSVTSLFKGEKDNLVHDKREKVPLQRLYPGYPENQEPEERIKFLIKNAYIEAVFEKFQFAKKWMRNSLVFQGYHRLDWVEPSQSWEAIVDSEDFPNNFYRSHIIYGASLYVKNAPLFVARPASTDYKAQAVAQASHSALDIIKENVNFDSLRVLEAIYLRLYGNSFRYAYYSLDPRYGAVTNPVFTKDQLQLDEGRFVCSACGNFGDGNPLLCPVCGSQIPPENLTKPTTANYPKKVGTVTYPKGQERTDAVTPLEMYVRSSAPDLFHAPYLLRARVVDKLALSADNPDFDFGGGDQGQTNEGGAASDDISLIYQQSLADLPGDPMQLATWYERATAYAKLKFIQGWIRPSQYAFDKELLKKFPDGIYGELIGDKLPKSRNESIDDHWTHFKYIPVPGRFWGDGDDDVIPKQLQLDESDRLILRNQAFCSVPKMAIDTQRVDKEQIINDPESSIVELKQNMGKPARDAIELLSGQSLPNETWQWRNAIKEDMEYHSGVFGSAIGMHQPGVNTMGGQQDMAGRTEQALSPMLLLYKEANEHWARQMLKIAAKNWLDQRVRAVMGLNGTWEFKQLRGSMLDLDQVQVIANLIPIDYAQQQALMGAVSSGLLDPRDPRVQTKALELYQLPTELSVTAMDSKVQWKEIEKMKSGKTVKPVLLRDNDEIHAEICRTWLNSDEGDDYQESNPQVWFAVYQHMQEHVRNAAIAAQVKAAVQLAPQELAAALGIQANQPQQPQPQRKPGTKPETQTGHHGGQVPRSSQVRDQRARKAQASAPNLRQPSSGNQYHRSPQTRPM